MAEYISKEALKQELLRRSFYPVIVKNAIESLPTIEIEDEPIPEDVGHENIVDAYIADGICEDCDQDPTKCIHQGYCEYDRQNELKEANNDTE